jgi:hypothetical protein
MLDFPLYMRTQPEEFYKSFMEDRRIFSAFVQSHIRNDVDNILIQLNEFINNKYPTKVAVWVGGSRSWNTSMKCKYSTIDMNTLENNAIIPGNYDVFIISNDKIAHSDVLCKTKILVEDYINKFKAGSLGTKYDLVKTLGNIDKTCDNINYPNEIGSCTLFPCQSIMVKIKSKNVKKYTTRKTIKYESTSELSSPFEDSRSVFSQQEFDNIAGLNDDDYVRIMKYKLLFYVESFLIPNVNVQLFKSALLFSNCMGNEMVINYLNPMGLLMMSEFISSPRKHKGLNVDDFRKRLLLKAVESVESISTYDAYKQTLDVYVNIFGESDVFDKYLLQTLLQQMMISSNINITEQIEKQFIPVIRPYINSFLRDLDFNIMSLYEEDVFLTIVGGDAMRRYDINISNTSDFDTKLYVNIKKIMSN